MLTGSMSKCEKTTQVPNNIYALGFAIVLGTGEIQNEKIVCQNLE